MHTVKAEQDSSGEVAIGPLAVMSKSRSCPGCSQAGGPLIVTLVMLAAVIYNYIPSAKLLDAHMYSVAPMSQLYDRVPNNHFLL